jgi:hypothetical protein
MIQLDAIDALREFRFAKQPKYKKLSAVIASGAKQSISPQRTDGLRREACHRGAFG